jgi:hypothetical protein
MAKMFYTLDEAKAALGKNEEEIKQFAREGKLREFRDGPRLMFKADQVEVLKAELTGGGGGLDHVDLGPSDSGIGSGLGSGEGGLSLADTDGGRSPGAGMTLKEDTALAADLGLSGSLGGIPSPANRSGAGSGLGGSKAGSMGGSKAGSMGGSKAGSMGGSVGGSMGGSLGGSLGGSMGGSMGGTKSGSRSGIDVFQNDEVDRVDPAAQTAVSASDHLSSESIGSGSGLLDLTRESDDTSLGAELLDEIAPGGTGVRKSPGESAAGGTMSGLVDSPRGVGTRSSSGPAPVQYFEKPDPMAPAFGAAALGAALVVIFGAFALITGVLDTSPSILEQVASKGFLIVAGAGVAVSLIFFVIGLVLGKAGAR